jgi:DNA-binding protein HU-beta
MKKEQLINRVAEIKEGTKKDATQSVDAVFQAIEEALKRGEEVNLAGLLKITIKDVPATEEKTMISPLTKQEITVAAKPATKKAVAKLGKLLKEAPANS